MILDGTGNDAYMGIPLGWDEEVYLDFPPLRYLALLLPSSASRLLPGKVGSLFDRFRKPLRELFVSWQGWSEKEILELFSLDPNLGGTELSRLSGSFRSMNGVELKTEVLCRIWEPDTVYRKAVQPANFLDLPISYPFADSRLAGFFATLPKALCFSGRVNKVLLREYMNRHLPKRIVEKPKGDFEFNPDVLLRLDRHAVLRKYLYDEASDRARIECLGRTIPAVHRYTAGDSDLRSRIFALVLLRVWLEQHPAGRLCP